MKKLNIKNYVSISVSNRIFYAIYSRNIREIHIKDRDRRGITKAIPNPIVIEPKNKGNGFVPLLLVLPIMISEPDRDGECLFIFNKLASGIRIGEKIFMSTLTAEENLSHFRFNMGCC